MTVQTDARVLAGEQIDDGTPLSVTLIGSDLYGVTAFGGADDD